MKILLEKKQGLGKRRSLLCGISLFVRDTPPSVAYF